MKHLHLTTAIWAATGILMVILILLAAPLSAAELKDSIVRVSGCTGVCVSTEGHILTVKHCKVGETTKVVWPNGKTVSAKRVWVSPEKDGAVVLDCDGDGYPFLKLATRKPTIGENVRSFGYPMGSKEVQEWAGVMRAGGRLPLTPSVSAYVVSGNILPGHSGGPLLDVKGNVYGLASQTSMTGESYWIRQGAVMEAYAAVIETRRPTVYVFSAKWCPACQTWKQREYPKLRGYNVKILEHGTKEYREVAFQAERATGTRVASLPTIWVEGDRVLRVGYQIASTIIKVVKSVIESFIKNPVVTPDAEVPDSVFVPPAPSDVPPEPYVRSEPSELEGLRDKVTGLLATVGSLKENVSEFQNGNVFVKAKNLPEIKGDLKTLKEGAAELKDSVTENKDGLKKVAARWALSKAKDVIIERTGFSGAGTVFGWLATYLWMRRKNKTQTGVAA